MKIYWHALLLVCLSCETIVEVDSPEYASEPVVTSFFSPDSIWSVTMHRSIGASVKQNVHSEYISDASILIMDGTDIVDVLNYQGRGRYVSKSDMSPIEGINYTLRVDIPNKPSVQASSIAPSPVSLLSYSLESVQPSSFDAQSSNYRLNVAFSDMKGTNYYRIGVYRYVWNRYGREETDPDSVYGQIWLENFSSGWSCGYSMVPEVYVDPIGGGGTEGIGDVICGEFVVTDRLFDGEDYSWSGTTGDLSPDFGRKELRLILSSISEDYFKYMQSLERNELRDPLTEEPFPMFSNVNDGLGVFAGYTNTTVVFPIFQED